MNIVIVEDKIAEVSGYVKQLKSNGHTLKRFTTFSQAYYGLVVKQEAVDLLIIDIMLPWGDKVDDEVDSLFDWKRSGLYLIFAIRNIENNDLIEIRRRSKLPKEFSETLQRIPIIALTKVPEQIEEDITSIPRAAIVAKLDGLNMKRLPELVCELNEESDQANDSGTPIEIAE